MNKLDLNWLLDDIVRRVVGVQNALVLSADGLQLGRSGEMKKDDSDHLSAIASSLQSLAKGVSRQFSFGHVLQNMIEMEQGYLFVLAAGEGACLAVLAERDVDIEMIASAMNRLVKQVGDSLTAAPRETVKTGSEMT